MLLEPCNSLDDNQLSCDYYGCTGIAHYNLSEVVAIDWMVAGIITSVLSGSEVATSSKAYCMLM